jgi:hypothetical protein
VTSEEYDKWIEGWLRDLVKSGEVVVEKMSNGKNRYIFVNSKDESGRITKQHRLDRVIKGEYQE